MDFMKIQILAIGMLILGAYTGGVIAKKIKLGETVGQILGGMLVGPHFWVLIHNWAATKETFVTASFFQKFEYMYTHGFKTYGLVIEESHFFVFFFLGLIAFSLGEELHFDRLKQMGIKPTIICLTQAMLAWVSITLVFYKIFHLVITPFMR